MSKVLVLSDLHLDHSNFKIDVQGADIIVLAGDIAGRNQLLEELFYYQIPKDIPTIFVPGNHEYEHHNFWEKNEQMKNICNDYGVHFLLNKTVIINGIRFIGSTLFSNLSGYYQRYFPDSQRAKTPSDSLKEWAQLSISDFKLIKHNASLGGENKWTVDDMIAQFQESYHFLKNELEQSFNGKTFVVTHFAPLFDFSKMDVPGKDMEKNSYWANHIPELVEMADFWVCGHSHTPKTVQQGKCTAICNPRGYSQMFNQPQMSTFDPHKLVEV